MLVTVGSKIIFKLFIFLIALQNALFMYSIIVDFNDQ